MNKSILIGSVLGAVAVTAGGAIGGYQMLKGEEFAEVVEVRPVAQTINIPREECRDVPVTRQRPVKDQHQVTGTVIGAVVGGVLGNQVGGGSGKKVATVAGAAAGGYAGNKVQENMQKGDTYTTVERVCETVNETQQQVIGYDVTYSLDGKLGTVRMGQEPGDRIPAKDGQLVLGQVESQ